MTQEDSAQSCPLSFTSHMYIVYMHWSQMCKHTQTHITMGKRKSKNVVGRTVYSYARIYVCVCVYAYLRLSQNLFKVNQGHYCKPTDKQTKTYTTLAR